MKRNRILLPRRNFLASLGRTAVVGSLAGLDISRFAHAAGSDTIRLGLVGSGGRGSGAVANALKTGKDIRLVAIADLFEDKINQSLAAIRKPANPNQITVPQDRRFVGFNAYQQLLSSGVDAVILATPPGFRPLHFEAAVNAGLHCFLEKPIAVDAPGVRQVRASAALAGQRGLAVVVGFQEHFDNSFRQCLAEISNGALGKITRLKAIIHWEGIPRHAARATVENQLGRPPTEMEFQLRNWYPFVWLCGDMIVEVLVHHLNTCWSALGRAPALARGKAERREHTSSEYGDISDFLSGTYVYPDGTELQAEMSALARSAKQYETIIEGEKGVARMPNSRILDRQGQVIWSFSGPNNNPYDEEMSQWCDSIRNRKPLNMRESAADSTLMAIMGRTAAYTGREVTWSEMLRSKETFFTHNPKSFQEAPPFLPDKFGDYEFPTRGVNA
jgi:predicted dehydrogenase